MTLTADLEARVALLEEQVASLMTRPRDRRFKLSPEQVAEARELHDKQEWGWRRLGKHYGVHWQTVYRALRTRDTNQPTRKE